MQRIVIEFCLATPVHLPPKDKVGEGESSVVVVTCVGIVHDRKSIFANIPVS